MAQHIYSLSSGNDMFWSIGGGLNNFVVVGNISGSAEDSAVRFRNVTVPQGTVLTAASVRLYKQSPAVAGSVLYTVKGIDEDNTSDFTTNPMGRSDTSAQHDGATSANLTNAYVGFDVLAEMNEIVARGGWSSGNSIGFKLLDHGTSTANARITDLYDGNSSTDAYLDVTWDEPSGSASQSRSNSPSLSPSSSLSPSGSASPSGSVSPSAVIPFSKGVLKVAKPGVDVLTNSDPEKFIFSSEFGTLKYFDKEESIVSFDANAGAIGGHGTITHNLGYYPFVEVFVRVYIGSPSGNYEYCPFAGAGATVFYDANYKITSTTIELYGQINGVSSSVWNFDFLVFIYKNNLQL